MAGKLDFDVYFQNASVTVVVNLWTIQFEHLIIDCCNFVFIFFNYNFFIKLIKIDAFGIDAYIFIETDA